MGNDTRETSDRTAGRTPAQIGRVRFTEEARYPDQGSYPDQPAGPYRSEDGWSLQAIVLGVVALSIIVAALLLILWGSFQR